MNQEKETQIRLINAGAKKYLSLFLSNKMDPKVLPTNVQVLFLAPHYFHVCQTIDEGEALRTYTTVFPLDPSNLIETTETVEDYVLVIPEI